MQHWLGGVHFISEVHCKCCVSEIKQYPILSRTGYIYGFISMYYPFDEYIGIYLKGCVSAEILLPSRHSERQA